MCISILTNMQYMGPVFEAPIFFAQLKPEILAKLKKAKSYTEIKKVLKTNNITTIPGFFHTVKNPAIRRHQMSKMIKGLPLYL